MSSSDILEYLIYARFYDLKRFNIFVYVCGGGGIILLSLLFWMALFCSRKRSPK
jgi:hypothetical protein